MAVAHLPSCPVAVQFAASTARMRPPGPYSGSRRVCAGRCGLVATRRCASHRAAMASQHLCRSSSTLVNCQLPHRHRGPMATRGHRLAFARIYISRLPRRPACAAMPVGPIARNRGHGSPAGGVSTRPSGLNRRTSAVHNSVRSHRIADSQPTVLRRHHCRPAALSRVSGSS